LVKSRYVELVQDVVSVMAAYCDLWGVCAVHSTHASQVKIWKLKCWILLMHGVTI